MIRISPKQTPHIRDGRNIPLADMPVLCLCRAFVSAPLIHCCFYITVRSFEFFLHFLLLGPLHLELPIPRLGKALVLTPRIGDCERRPRRPGTRVLQRLANEGLVPSNFSTSFSPASALTKMALMTFMSRILAAFPSFPSSGRKMPTASSAS